MTTISTAQYSSSEKKERRIALDKALMTQEIDAHTYKYVDATPAKSMRQENAVSSDTDEQLDGGVIRRLMEYRDSELRIFLRAHLKEEEVTCASNSVSECEHYRYDLMLRVAFQDSNLHALAMLLHKYIVWGVLYDWYRMMGLQEASAYGAELEQIERDIKDMLNPTAYVKRPMQPFGPAKFF